MTTDNRTNEQLSGISGQFTDEQVEAAVHAAWDKSREFRGIGGQTEFAPPWEFQQVIRAALVAAQGAAPVLPSSGVDEDALAEEIGRHKLVHVSVSRKSAFCACNPSVTAGVDDNRAWFEGHRARAVAEWLMGQGR